MYNYSYSTSPWYSNTSKVKSVIIGNSVTSIGSYAFYDCTNLASVYYTGDIAGWCKIKFDSFYSNPVYYANNLYIDGALVEGDIVIPDGVTAIRNYTFTNCDGITSVTIPNSVTSIGYQAFFGCSSLASITIPESVEIISPNMFLKCTALKEVTIPKSVTDIGLRAFYGCRVTVDKDNTAYSNDEIGALFNKDKTTLVEMIEKEIREKTLNF